MNYILSIEGINSRTKVYSSQTNDIVERFNKTMKSEFYDFSIQKKLYSSVDELKD